MAQPGVAVLLGTTGLLRMSGAGVGAGEAERRGMKGEACFYRIVFDVALDAGELGGVADPMVEGFVLPERAAGAAEKRVRCARRDAFQAVGDAGNRDHRIDEGMHVVGHDDPRVQVVVIERDATKKDGFNDGRDSGVG